MTPEDRVFMAGLSAERAGVAIDPEKAYLIESRLGPAARREGFGSVADLVEAARNRPDERLMAACVEAMAPTETRFFRDRPVFEHLWREIVPELARRRPDGAVRIWSAGCGPGQEIFSLAMLQAEAPAPTGRVELFASDLSERLLERARAAVYSSFEVQRGLSARQLVRHFENHHEHFQLAKRVRQEVRWRRVNLMDDLTPLGAFDVVLCRYVLNCFTEVARAQAAAKLAALVAPGGALVLGEDEALAVEGFAPVGLGGVFRRVGEARAAA